MGRGGRTGRETTWNNPSVTPRTDLERVESLADAGRVVEAVDLLAAINARRREPVSEIRLVDLRARAAAATTGVGRSPWPPVYPDPFPALDGRIPEVDAEFLTTETLAGAVSHHGCLIVRGVISDAHAADFVDAIERAQRAREHADAQSEAGIDDSVAAWYRPFVDERDARDDDRMMSAKRVNTLRKQVVNGGGIWLADSPAVTARVLDALAETHVIESVRGHFGERPFFSLQKSTLRRVAPVHKYTSWHQDGSFLDPAVRSMNLWLSLSHCGGDQPTPALEVVPKRVPDVLPVSNEMANFAISFDLVKEIAKDAPTVVPEFAPGDALMFDERFVHRTHLTQTMTRPRYALECWMFAPSHQSPNYTPLLI
jgi:ectoine hydroxylase-related dioxygenase (phytanoyl-CoA dioxygenase family)